MHTFQMKNFRDIIEDTLVRLEEFQSIVSMVSTLNISKLK